MFSDPQSFAELVSRKTPSKLRLILCHSVYLEHTWHCNNPELGKYTAPPHRHVEPHVPLQKKHQLPQI